MSEWKEKEIGDILTELSKSKIPVSKATGFGDYPFFTSGDAILQNDTFLVEEENIFLATGGVANLKYYNGKAAYSTDTYAVKTSEDSCKYIYFWLSNNLTFINNQLFLGSGLKHLQKNDLRKVKVFLPTNIGEQTRIAEILSTADEAIAHTGALIAKYQRLKTGLMQDLLTKGIDENGNIRSKETHKFVIKNGIEVPEEWEVDSLKNRCNLHNNLRKPIAAIDRFQNKGSFPYYGATGIIDYINEYRVEGLFVLIGEDGDHYLKFKSQEMTHLVEGKFNVSNHAHILSGKENCSTKWIHYFFCHRDITYFLTRQGAGRFKLNKASLQNLPICVPSPKEQTRIIERIECFNDNFNLEKQKLVKLHSLKTGLMQDLLSGKVRVNIE